VYSSSASPYSESSAAASSSYSPASASGGWAVGVLGSLDELGLGFLEALGLAAAGLLDRAPGLGADAGRP
jgi:hypothetical protein